MIIYYINANIDAATNISPNIDISMDNTANTTTSTTSSIRPRRKRQYKRTKTQFSRHKQYKRSDAQKELRNTKNKLNKQIKNISNKLCVVKKSVNKLKLNNENITHQMIEIEHDIVRDTYVETNNLYDTNFKLPISMLCDDIGCQRCDLS